MEIELKEKAGVRKTEHFNPKMQKIKYQMEDVMIDKSDEESFDEEEEESSGDEKDVTNNIDQYIMMGIYIYIYCRHDAT